MQHSSSLFGCKDCVCLCVCTYVFLNIFQRSTSASTPEQQVKLEDILPLAFTRLCEPKEASYSLIKKYVSQYYPKLKVDIRYVLRVHIYNVSKTVLKN